MLPWGAARFDDAAAQTVSGGGGGTPFAITYGTTKTSTSPSTNTYTLTSVDVGTPGATSVIALGFAWISAATITGVTIGGNAMSHATGANQANGTAVSSDIWYLAYSGAAAPTVVVTFSTTAPSRLTTFPWNITGTGAGFSVASGSNSAGAKTTTSGALAVPAGGGTVSVSMFGSSGTPTAAAGMNVTDASSNSLWGVNWLYAGHDATNTGTQTFTTTFTASTNAQVCGSYAAFTA